jgi:hypothetical protein
MTTKQSDWAKTDPNDPEYNAAAAEAVIDRNPPPEPLTFEEEFGEPDPTKDRDYQQPTDDETATLAAAVADAFAPEDSQTALTLPDYLARLEAFLTKYIAFPTEHEPVAVTLWAAHSHIADQFDWSPYLAVTSAEKRSGKTTLLRLLALVVPHARFRVLPSASAFFRAMARTPRPTMLLDEVDAIFGGRQAEKYEELRGILNAGTTKDTTVDRIEMRGTVAVPVEFKVFGPKALASIGDLPDTITDRSIVIRLKRQPKGGHRLPKARIRSIKADAAGIVGTWAFIGTWAFAADPERTEVPEELNDRASDNWEPLLAIADEAGGDWPERARTAALAISGDEDEPLTTGVRLLRDIHDVFGEATFLQSTYLLERLHGVEDAPWNEWYGRPLTASGLAKLLGKYGIGPKQHRIDGPPTRGYFLADFADAFSRYVAPVPDVPDVQASDPREGAPTLPEPTDLEL